MNYIGTGFWGITVLALVLGIAFGAMRGARRSVLRLVLVLACVVGAYFLREPVTNFILNYEVKGTTIRDTILGILPESFAGLGDTVIILVSVLASVFVFIATFYALKFLTWLILFPIGKIFVKKGKKKRPLIGMLVGLVQGAIVALCVCVPLGGLMVQTNKLVVAAGSVMESFASMPADDYYALAEDDESVSDGDEATQPDDKEDGGETPTDPSEGGESGETPAEPSEGGEESKGGLGSLIPKNISDMMGKLDKDFLGKFYTKTLKKPFAMISTVRIQIGESKAKEYSLEGQVNAIVGAVQLVQDFAELRKVQWDGEFDGDFAQQIRDIFAQIEKTKNSLSKESLDTISSAAGALLNQIDMPIELDISEIDLSQINFEEEGDLIVKIVDMANGEEFSAEDMKEIAQDLTNSNLVSQVLEHTSADIELSETNKQMLGDAFDEIEGEEGYNQEMLEKLRDILGIPKKSAGSESPVVPQE